MSRTTVLVIVEGGLVQDVLSDKPLDFIVLDCDLEGPLRIKAAGRRAAYVKAVRKLSLARKEK